METKTKTKQEGNPMNKKTTERHVVVVDIPELGSKAADDWALIVAVCYYMNHPLNISGLAAEDLFRSVYARNDAYGNVGTIPPQGFDWSGIRDSSPEAQANMANYLREQLVLRGVKVYAYAATEWVI